MNPQKQSTDKSFFDDLSDAVRANPISAALIGVGAIWLFGGNRVLDVPMAAARTAGEAAGSLQDTAVSGLRSGADTMSSGISKIRTSIGEAATSTGDSGETAFKAASEQMSAARDWSGDVIDNIQDNISTLLREQPLVLGAVGIAVGAAVAASLPLTDIERDNLGSAAQSARTMAINATDQVIERAEGVADAIGEEMTAQGLTTDAASAVSKDLTRKAKDILSVLPAKH